MEEDGKSLSPLETAHSSFALACAATVCAPSNCLVLGVGAASSRFRSACCSSRQIRPGSSCHRSIALLQPLGDGPDARVTDRASDTRIKPARPCPTPPRSSDGRALGCLHSALVDWPRSTTCRKKPSTSCAPLSETTKMYRVSLWHLRNSPGTTDECPSDCPEIRSRDRDALLSHSHCPPVLLVCDARITVRPDTRGLQRRHRLALASHARVAAETPARACPRPSRQTTRQCPRLLVPAWDARHVRSGVCQLDPHTRSTLPLNLLPRRTGNLAQRFCSSSSLAQPSQEV